MDAFDKLSAACDAHKGRAGETPSVVRNALLPDAQTVCGITIHPFTLGILMLLEKIEHPELTGGTAGIADSANALFIFSDPIAAKSAISQGRDYFDQAAFEFCLEKVPASSLPKISEAMREQIALGMSTVPGRFSPETEDTSPLAPPRPAMPVSAGN
jgi:hypothetical protein